MFYKLTCTCKLVNFTAKNKKGFVPDNLIILATFHPRKILICFWVQTKIIPTEIYSLQILKCKIELIDDTYTKLRGEIAGPPDTPFEGKFVV